ncbi:hypothetical protein H0264_21800 [Nocardia huaxiensis]|uniref:Uncharacterized protein n=1 Tax=Nocardia huaxiensis TaxID=2755382 RepID=A0A7D6Z934_9NOCA|nr:hypothetical protein [Nocardia huaxiensis]QLY28038.1 hypothetical protein H0264_21800 [Nocardia huaxiensis]
MVKPQFRHDLAAWMDRRPFPIPQIWRVADTLHHIADAALTGVEKTHFGIRDHIVLVAAARVGVSDTRIKAFRERHNRFYGGLYRRLRAAHWYV